MTQVQGPRGYWPRWGGSGAVNTKGDLYTELHSLFTREPASSLPSLDASGLALGSGGAGLGRAAAGARGTLCAADTVGCTAVLRGRRGRGDLLPSRCFSCV